MKTKQQFIIDLLKPYILNPSTCARNNIGGCEYLTEDGRKCAIGMYMKKGKWQHFEWSVAVLSDEYNLNHILKKSILRHNISLHGLSYIQSVHDKMSRNEDIMFAIKRLEQIESIDLTELKELLT